MLDIDLKLLAIFEEIYRTRSVSQAAENLRVSQPTVSISLGKLRRFFNDPLFVRTSGGMEPTPHASELLKPVADALAQLRYAVRHRIVFDPLKSERCFRVCLTDISQIVLLPKLLNHLREAAPSIRIDVINIAANTPALLETGEADLAIGFMPQLEAGFYQQRLFRQRFVCLVRKDHPRIRDKLTLKQFVEESHVQIATSGTGHWIIDKVLEEQQVKRKIALRLPNFLGIASIVANTNLLVVVPARLADLLVELDHVKALKSPIDFPGYEVKQHWHERYHHDPRNQWLRGVVAELFLSPEGEKRIG